MLALLIIATFIISISSKFGNKKLQTIFPEGNVAYAFYALIIGIISIINLLIMTGFRPNVSFNLIALSFVYAIFCRLSYMVTFKSLKYNGVFVNDTVSRVGSIIPPIVISALVLGEKQSLGTILGGVVVIVAAMLPGISSVDNSKSTSRAGLFCAMVILAINTAVTMLSKVVVSLEGAESMLSYALFTNVFIAVTATFSFVKEIRKGGMIREIRRFKKEHYLLTFVVATASNLSGYVGRYMLEIVDVIQSTIISSSLAVVATIMISLLYKEKLTKRHFISAILSVVAAVLPVVM